MADSDPNTPQVVDPELTVDLTRLLQIRGPLGLLNVLDTIVPVVNMGDVVTRTVQVQSPAYRSTDVFSAGEQTNAPANTVHADTGALAEGIYDVFYDISLIVTVGMRWDVEHRNAANSTNLAVWRHAVEGTSGSIGILVPSFGYEFAANERLRIINLTAPGVGFTSNAFLFARRRA